MNFYRISLFFLLLLGFAACHFPSGSNVLPILGERDIVDGDTVYHQIPDFAFVDQDSQLITNNTFAGKAYVGIGFRYYLHRFVGAEQAQVVFRNINGKAKGGYVR